jgi:hypothetical protein
VCPYRSRIFSLKLTEKIKEREDVAHVGRRAISRIIAQIRPNPRRGGAKTRCLQVSRLRMILRAKMILQGLATRGGNEPSRARLGSARCGSFTQRARLGSARSSDELGKAARLGSLQAREPARRANEPIHKFKSAL